MVVGVGHLLLLLVVLLRRRVVKLLLLLLRRIVLLLLGMVLRLVLLVLPVKHTCNNLRGRRRWNGLVIVLVDSHHETEGSNLS